MHSGPRLQNYDYMITMCSDKTISSIGCDPYYSEAEWVMYRYRAIIVWDICLICKLYEVFPK